MKKYLAEDAPSVPPTGSSRAGTQPPVIGPFIDLGELDTGLTVPSNTHDIVAELLGVRLGH